MFENAEVPANHSAGHNYYYSAVMVCKMTLRFPVLPSTGCFSDMICLHYICRAMFHQKLPRMIDPPQLSYS